MTEQERIEELQLKKAQLQSELGEKPNKKKKSVLRIIRIPLAIIGLITIINLLLHIFLPNTTEVLVRTLEIRIYEATGVQWDLNGDGKNEGYRQQYQYYNQDAAKPVIYIYNTNEMERITK